MNNRRLAMGNTLKRYLGCVVIASLMCPLISYADNNKKTKQCNIFKKTFQASVGKNWITTRVASLKEKTAKECCDACHAYTGSNTGMGSSNIQVYYTYCGGNGCSDYGGNGGMCVDVNNNKKSNAAY